MAGNDGGYLPSGNRGFCCFSSGVTSLVGIGACRISRHGDANDGISLRPLCFVRHVLLFSIAVCAARPLGHRSPETDSCAGLLLWQQRIAEYKQKASPQVLIILRRKSVRLLSADDHQEADDNADAKTKTNGEDNNKRYARAALRRSFDMCFRRRSGRVRLLHWLCGGGIGAWL